LYRKIEAVRESKREDHNLKIRRRSRKKSPSLLLKNLLNLYREREGLS
jgi:hypothetical protein